jgi:intracellular sulfur oxidation DsrE/DsrF family protein
MKNAFAPMLAALLLATAPMAANAAEEKVVYHVNDSANARVAMNNVNNHLNAAPGAKIVVVTHGKGIDFLLNDAKDDKGEYAPAIAGLKEKGVDFRVCANTLKARKLDANAVVPEATVVPSGVAEIGKLQAQEGYVYLKP